MRKGDDPAGGTTGNVHPLWAVSIRQSIQHLSRCDSETQKCGGTRGNLNRFSCWRTWISKQNGNLFSLMKCFILDKEQRTDQQSTEFLSMKKKKSVHHRHCPWTHSKLWAVWRTWADKYIKIKHKHFQISFRITILLLITVFVLPLPDRLTDYLSIGLWVSWCT